MQGEQPKPPIINCHTHVFTGDHVPPYLARSIVIAPFYRLLNFRRVFAILRKHYLKKDQRRFDGSENLKARTKFQRNERFKQQEILYALFFITGWYLTLWSLHIILHWLFGLPTRPVWLAGWLQQADRLLHWPFPVFENPWYKAAVIAPVIFFFRSGRNLLWFLLKQSVSLLKKIPGKQTRELLERYMTIGRFAFHKRQSSTLSDLEDQYPEGTGFVILPMDMAYMDAGLPPVSYADQMAELARLKARKDHIYPFVFVDPRRIAADKTFFDYQVTPDGKIVLNKCFIKDYIEGHMVKDEKGEKELGMARFSGFKIYPALGYYPFDPLLLPLWKYAEQENLPILTHCVEGPMYFRGKKQKAWNYHPILQELIQPLPAGTVPQPEHFTCLLLAEKKNDAFSANFTHPLNYACLLKKEFLTVAVDNAYKQLNTADREKLRTVFGLTPSEKNEKGEKITEALITKDLNNLKLCFGHYGGAEEWHRYFEKDRFNHSAQITGRPDFGIDFLYYLSKGQSTTTRSLGKPEQLWKHTDWYSIISSLILQHEKVYADISYILHNDAAILPLLKQTLQNDKLRQKILYGTDFYVVRNHKSDKNMLADMMGGLAEEDFDQIARKNPRTFLGLQ